MSRELSVIGHCFKKRWFETWEEAEEAATKTMHEAPDGGGPLMAYKCRLFDHWHYGHLVKVDWLLASQQRTRRSLSGLQRKDGDR